jgi:hypothetical protein
MTDKADIKGVPKTVTKSLKYSVRSKFVNFNPDKYAQKIIIVNGKAAIKISGRVYKMILAKE